MKQRLLDALKKANADYAEIRFEENDGTNFAYRGKELEAASTACNTGGIVRACKNGGWELAFLILWTIWNKKWRMLVQTRRWSARRRRSWRKSKRLPM